LWKRQGQLAQELSQAKVNAENAAKELENRARAEAAAKKKAEAAKQAKSQRVNETFV
jgi:membrane protein involved in colicin uptake